QSFMNVSGEVVASFAKDLRAEPSEILVLHDEADFDQGRIQLKKGGASAGHNGLESIIEKLGSKDFWRLRIGVGKDSSKQLADYVLEPVSQDVIKPLGELGADALDKILEFGLEKAIHVV